MTLLRADMRDTLRANGWKSIQGGIINSNGQRLELWLKDGCNPITLKRAWDKHQRSQAPIPREGSKVSLYGPWMRPKIALCVAESQASSFIEGSQYKGEKV
jgi:hypothetical protein